MLWIIVAVIASMLIATGAEINRHFKQDGFYLNFWRCIFAATVLLPVLVLLDWTSDWRFYGAAIVTGLAVLFGNIVMFNLAAKHNGRVAVLNVPIKTFILFFAWLAIDQTQLQYLIAHPFQGAGILLCIGVTIAAMASIRSNDASWKALMMVAPVGLFFAVADVLCKLVLPNEGSADLVSSIVIFLFIVSLTSIVPSAIKILWQRPAKAKLFPKGMLKAAVVVGVLQFAMGAAIIGSIALAPNPAYAAAITMLTPVWLLVYHKIIGLKDDANPIAGTVMVVSAIALVLLTGGGH